MEFRLVNTKEDSEVRVVRELRVFRTIFSIATFLLCSVAFAIGFPALEDAGRKIGLGNLSLGLPFAIDLGMVTLLLWSMWNRGALKKSWPPLIPAVLLLSLSAWLQYIHAVNLVSEVPEPARTGLLLLACSLPLLLALSAGVFEAVTFAPLIDRARRHAEMRIAKESMEDKLWRAEMLEERRQFELEAELRRNRLEIQSKTELKLMEAEAEAAAKNLRVAKPTSAVSEDSNHERKFSSKSSSSSSSRVSSSKSYDESVLAEAIQAISVGEISQRAAAEKYGISRTTIRKYLEVQQAEGMASQTPELEISEGFSAPVSTNPTSELSGSDLQLSPPEKGGEN